MHHPLDHVNITHLHIPPSSLFHNPICSPPSSPLILSLNHRSAPTFELHDHRHVTNYRGMCWPTTNFSFLTGFGVGHTLKVCDLIQVAMLILASHLSMHKAYPSQV